MHTYAAIEIKVTLFNYEFDVILSSSIVNFMISYGYFIEVLEPLNILFSSLISFIMEVIVNEAFIAVIAVKE